jgi:HAD superfamily hydrolase (TIGR01509 family)
MLFDMDGVLTDTEVLYYEVNQKFFAQHSIPISGKEYDRFCGISAPKMWKSLKDEFNLPYEVDWLIQHEKETFFAELSAQPGLEPIPGIPDLLRAVAERRLKTAVASSSARKNIELILQKAGIRHFFPVIVSGEDVKNGKPDPDIFLLAASQVGAAPNECVVLEDSFNGLTAAKKAGMYCVGFRNPGSGNQDLSQADMIINEHTPKSLPSILALFD